MNPIIRQLNNSLATASRYRASHAPYGEEAGEAPGGVGLAHYRVLDTFRGLCAVAVVIAHFNAVSITNSLPLFVSGSLYVDFFFVLSGFVIYANYRNRLTDGSSIKDFMWLRFWRLYPLHLAVLMAFLAIESVQLIVPGPGSQNAPFSAPGEDSWSIAMYFLLTHSLHTVRSLSFNWPSWSIGVEFWTYLVFATLLVAMPRRWPFAAAGFATACVCSLAFLRSDLFAMNDFGVLRCIYGFACGIAAFEVLQALPAPKRGTALEAAALASILAYLAWGVHGRGSFVAPVVFAAFIVLFAFESGKFSGWLNHRICLRIGDLSYSIYMTHMFLANVVFVGVRAAGRYLPWKLTTGVQDKTSIGTNLANGTIAEVVFVGVVIAVSHFTFRYIETPARDWSRATRYRPMRRHVAKIAPSGVID